MTEQQSRGRGVFRLFFRANLWASYPAAFAEIILLILEKLDREGPDTSTAAAHWTGWVCGAIVICALSPAWMLPSLIGFAAVAAFGVVELYPSYYAALTVYLLMFVGTILTTRRGQHRGKAVTVSAPPDSP